MFTVPLCAEVPESQQICRKRSNNGIFSKENAQSERMRRRYFSASRFLVFVSFILSGMKSKVNKFLITLGYIHKQSQVWYF